MHILWTHCHTAFAVFVWAWFKRWREPDPDGYYHRLERYFARAAAALVFLQPLSGLSFFLRIRSTSGALAAPTPYAQLTGGQATPYFHLMFGLAAVALLCSVLYWILGHERGRHVLLVAPLALALAFVCGGFTREKARKPYLIHSYMTMNMRVPEAKEAAAAALSGAKVYADQGCSSCHALRGAGGTEGPGLDGLAKNYDVERLKAFLDDPGENMPAYDGTPEGLDALAGYLLEPR